MQAAFEFIWKLRVIALLEHDQEIEAYAEALLRNQQDLIEEIREKRNREVNNTTFSKKLKTPQPGKIPILKLKRSRQISTQNRHDKLPLFKITTNITIHPPENDPVRPERKRPPDKDPTPNKRPCRPEYKKLKQKE
jgi:hypothetical protein